MARSKKPRCRNCHHAWIYNSEPVGCQALPPKVKFLQSPGKVSPVCKDWSPIKPWSPTRTLKEVKALELSMALGPEFGTATAGHIANIRESMNMTQQTFAAALKVSEVTVNRWENGKTIPKSPTFVAKLTHLATRGLEPWNLKENKP